MFAKLIFYGIIIALCMFSTVVGRKVLSHFSFIVTPCHYLINCMKDSCCFIDDYCSVIIVLRTLAGLPRVRFEMLGIAAKYDVDDLHYSTETAKNAVWFSFVNNIRFQLCT